MIKENIKDILKNIQKINSKAIIIAVTKTVEVNRIKEAIEAGILNIGENKVQEAEKKIPEIKKEYNNITFHFIGHLQSNKVNKAINLFDMIQSIDSLKILNKLNNGLRQKNMTKDILIELKVSEEDTKFGVSEEEILKLIEEIPKFKNIKVKGLMTMAPYFENPENARIYFRKAKKIFDEIKRNYKYENLEMKYLSMGMTNDYIIALEEGSNMVRIGTGIFGRRIYE